MPKGKLIDREKVKKLVEKGLSDIEISKILGCNWETVSLIRRCELGIIRKDVSGKKKREILRLLKQGKTYKEIVKTVGASYTYVYMIASSNKYSSGSKSGLTSISISQSLKMLGEVQKKPSFYKDLTKIGVKYPHNCFRIIRQHGIDIRKISISPSSRSAKRRWGKPVIFYLPHQKMEVYNMLRKIMGKDLGKRKRQILRMLGIEYVYKDGRFIRDGRCL